MKKEELIEKNKHLPIEDDPLFGYMDMLPSQVVNEVTWDDRRPDLDPVGCKMSEAARELGSQFGSEDTPETTRSTPTILRTYRMAKLDDSEEEKAKRRENRLKLEQEKRDEEERFQKKKKDETEDLLSRIVAKIDEIDGNTRATSERIDADDVPPSNKYFSRSDPIDVDEDTNSSSLDMFESQPEDAVSENKGTPATSPSNVDKINSSLDDLWVDGDADDSLIVRATQDMFDSVTPKTTKRKSNSPAGGRFSPKRIMNFEEANDKIRPKEAKTRSNAQPPVTKPFRNYAAVEKTNVVSTAGFRSSFPAKQTTRTVTAGISSVPRQPVPGINSSSYRGETVSSNRAKFPVSRTTTRNVTKQPYWDANMKSGYTSKPTCSVTTKTAPAFINKVTSVQPVEETFTNTECDMFDSSLPDDILMESLATSDETMIADTQTTGPMNPISKNSDSNKNMGKINIESKIRPVPSVEADFSEDDLGEEEMIDFLNQTEAASQMSAVGTLVQHPPHRAGPYGPKLGVHPNVPRGASSSIGSVAVKIPTRPQYTAIKPFVNQPVFSRYISSSSNASSTVNKISGNPSTAGASHVVSSSSASLRWSTGSRTSMPAAPTVVSVKTVTSGCRAVIYPAPALQTSRPAYTSAPNFRTTVGAAKPCGGQLAKSNICQTKVLHGAMPATVATATRNNKGQASQTKFNYTKLGDKSKLSATNTAPESSCVRPTDVVTVHHNMQAPLRTLSNGLNTSSTRTLPTWSDVSSTSATVLTSQSTVVFKPVDENPAFTKVCSSAEIEKKRQEALRKRQSRSRLSTKSKSNLS